MADKVYKFSSDFKAMSEGDFIQEIRKRFKVTKKEAKEIYNDLHGKPISISRKVRQTGQSKELGKGAVQDNKEE